VPDAVDTIFSEFAQVLGIVWTMPADVATELVTSQVGQGQPNARCLLAMTCR
jgi:hypothetical protein